MNKDDMDKSLAAYAKTAEFKFYNQEHFRQFKLNHKTGGIVFTPNGSVFIPFEEFEDDE